MGALGFADCTGCWSSLAFSAAVELLKRGLERAAGDVPGSILEGQGPRYLVAYRSCRSVFQPKWRWDGAACNPLLCSSYQS